MSTSKTRGISLSYRKTLDVLTVAYLGQFSTTHGPRKARELAREVAEELLRPALSERARRELDAIEAKRRTGKP